MSATFDPGAQRFWKMSGSGNDFVFFDARQTPSAAASGPEAIARLCDRRQGVGADGVVLLEPGANGASFRMAYFNSDGSRASMCGNAALCSTRLATELGAAPAAGFTFDSDVGPVRARLRDGLPEVDLAPIREVAPETPTIARADDESRIGFAVAGVPHLVVLCGDLDAVPLATRGAVLRGDPSLGPAGANANFVSREGAGGGWRMRTFERGVEGETLACGTGAVATAALLRAWGLTGGADAVELTTRSGRVLGVRLTPLEGGALAPSLRGEGRIVFEGEIREL